MAKGTLTRASLQMPRTGNLGVKVLQQETHLTKVTRDAGAGYWILPEAADRRNWTAPS